MKLVSVLLMAALVLSGPLAPLAWAQERTESQTAPVTATGDGVWMLGAAVATGVNIPAKASLCLLGAVAGAATLALTLGSGYKMAGRVWEEGCAGRWIITAADLRPTPAEPDFWSEKPEYQQ